MSGAERIAKSFHEAYERLAPEHGYETREASAKPWDEVPDQNRELMVAVVEQLLSQGDIEYGVLADASGPQGPRAQFEIFPAGDGFKCRLRGLDGNVVFADDEEHETEYAAEKSCADLVRTAMWARGVVAGGGFSINVERTEE